MKSHYDFIIAGGGASGLSLAFYLSLSGLKNSSVLIIDKDKKNKNDRTWGFWSNEKTTFEQIVSFRFKNLDFYSDIFEKRFDLQDYNYSIIQGIDFYNFIKNHLLSFPNFEFLNASIIKLSDEDKAAMVETDQGSFSANWVFNSIYNETEILKAASSSLYLRQHFKGWIIKTQAQTFDPSTFTMFDFRTPQKGLMRFFYVIPQSENRALVEYTLFSGNLLEKQAYDEAIKTYIDEILKITDYEIIDEEFGVIPMTNYKFPATQGAHIVNIGSIGGSSKPSSGYTFLRIQSHIKKIVAALEAGKNPAISAISTARYRFYDAVLLNILKHRGGLGERLFSYMFRNNSITQLFNFLDEKGGLKNDIKIILSMPPAPFIRSAAGLIFQKFKN